MEKVKKILNHIFIDGLSGMALGLFSTLIIGTIIAQIGDLIMGIQAPAAQTAGLYLIAISRVAKSLTGAGIGVGVAVKFKEKPLVTIAAAVAGLIGAFPDVAMTTIALGKPGEPLGAFVAAYAAIEIGHLVSGKTPVDIIITPFLSIVSGAVVGYIVGPPISRLMYWIGMIVNVNVEQSPVIGGIIVSVAMGMILTLPISSAAIGISMNLSGLAAGAAAVGCCCNMIGFAVASYRENKFGGFIAQGIGTSMLQMGNIVKNPRIWIAPILTSAITGPLATCLFKLQMNGTPVSSGMGTCGFVGQIGVYTGWMNDIAAGTKTAVTGWDWAGLLLISFILPAILCPLINMFIRKLGWVKDGDMTLS